MTNPDADPTRRALAQAATRTSDAGAELLASLTGMGRSLHAARTANHPLRVITRELRRGRAQARYRRARALIRPSLLLAERSAEVLAAAAACGLDNARVFGSCARGTDTRASDVDLLVDGGTRTSLLTISRFAIIVADLLGLPVERVDVVTDGGLIPGSHLERQITAECQPLAGWAAGLLRLESLPAAARRSFVLEILATARACAAVGGFERLTIALAAWKGTAEAYADPTIALDGSDLDYLDE